MCLVEGKPMSANSALQRGSLLLLGLYFGVSKCFLCRFFDYVLWLITPGHVLHLPIVSRCRYRRRCHHPILLLRYHHRHPVLFAM